MVRFDQTRSVQRLVWIAARHILVTVEHHCPCIRHHKLTREQGGINGHILCASQPAADVCTVCCSLFNNIKPPSWLPVGADFHLFKHGIEPKWEDPQCAKGGAWTLHIAKGRDAKAELDKHWLDGVRLCTFPALQWHQFASSESLHVWLCNQAVWAYAGCLLDLNAFKCLQDLMNCLLALFAVRSV